jgi:hypothetical protein
MWAALHMRTDGHDEGNCRFLYANSPSVATDLRVAKCNNPKIQHLYYKMRLQITFHSQLHSHCCCARKTGEKRLLATSCPPVRQLSAWLPMDGFSENTIPGTFKFFGKIHILLKSDTFTWRLNHLKTKRRLLYLKTQSVPRCKHFSSRL